jgi:Divergent InlB B-repeat domain/Bacterial Ig-like domain (group 2)
MKRGSEWAIAFCPYVYYICDSGWRARLDARSGAGMNRKWVGKSISTLGLLAVAVWLSGLSSCARSQQLQGITISPSAFTYFSPAPPNSQQTPIPLTAYGSFIHPAETKDITSKVTWASDQTIVADVSSSGGLTAGIACGTANISATFYTNGNKSGNLVVGFMAVTVEGPASQGCPTGTATQNLSVNVTGGPADGVITSTPAGITCGPTCSAAFSTGSTVTLTAVPNNPHSFLGWASGCTSISGSTCNVTMNSDVIVTASFN